MICGTHRISASIAHETGSVDISITVHYHDDKEPEVSVSLSQCKQTIAMGGDLLTEIMSLVNTAVTYG